MSDYFNFENKDYDFPFYRKNPHVSKLGWIVLFLACFIGYLLQLIPPEILGGILFCSVPLVAVLYYLNWDIKAIIRKPKAKEVLMAVLLFVGYMIYTIFISLFLDFTGLTGSDIVTEGMVTVQTLISLIFSMMGEELLKFVPFIFFMRLIFKYTDNRKLSVIASMLIVMVFFAFLHVMDLKSVVSCLLLQGFGSIFEFIGYIKTKNILISYITHLCTDAFIFALILMGAA